MIKLLFFRVVPLLLRPAAVLLEGMLVTDDYVLVLLLPVAMLALTISSIPVHLEYYRSHPGQAEHRLKRRKYSAALSWLTLIGLFILTSLLIILPVGFGPLLIGATSLTFLIEKLADESSRAVEFRKEFLKWFGIQTVRSGWFIMPIVASLIGYEYKLGFLIFSALICILMYFVFLRVTDVRPCLDIGGFKSIRDNMVFLAGSFLTATYVQLPRILVSKLFPEHAHIYLAMAQVCQGGGLVFNVCFQIPYRRLIARRPKLFQRRFWPVMLYLLVPVSFTSAFYFAGAASGQLVMPENKLYAAVLLAPILMADVIMFSILAAHLGYIQWFVNKWSALTTYLTCILSAAFLLGLIVSSGIWRTIPLICVPALTIVIGGMWLTIIIFKHFRKQPQIS